jgi:hypothetical protein
MDGIDLVENPRYHPDELAVNYLQQFTKRDVVVHELGESEATEEEIAEWNEDEIIEELSNNYTYLGEEDEIYYVM